MASRNLPLKERRDGGHGICLSPLEKRMSGVTITFMPHRQVRWASSPDLCTSTPEKKRSVAMVMPIPLLAGTLEEGHGLGLSPPEQRRSGVMVILSPHREGGQVATTSALLPQKSGECGHDHPKSSYRKKTCRRTWSPPLSSNEKEAWDHGHPFTKSKSKVDQWP